MSTKALREALDWLENYLDSNPEAQDARRRARTELEAIERAARSVSMFAAPEPDDIGTDVPPQEQLEHDLRLLRCIAKESKP